MAAADSQGVPAPGRWRKVRTALAVAGALLLIALAWHAAPQLAALSVSLDPVMVGLAMIAGVLLAVLQGACFALLMSANGGHTPMRDAVAAFLIGQPGKYVPGKVWSAVMQKAALGRGTPLAVVAAANIQLALLMLTHMAFLGILCLTLARPLLSLAAAAVGVIAGSLLLRLDLATPMSALAPRLAARLGLRPRSDVASRPGWASAIAMSAAVFAATLLASWLVLAAIAGDLEPARQAAALGSLFLGFGASLLVVVVPAGLGVREAATSMIGDLVAVDVGGSFLIAVAVVARVWQLAVDLFCLGVGLVMNRGRAPPETQD